ncbi:MAG: Regulatory protein PchR [Candidatus Ordinivivax streblomastigis]|uniref:Regulatory protein PchR n=1 Tax=Candidatus Ordinivivax streblomastigis TaxID=2540710 RepID=A0A5M8NUK4_9BACT|nr:MAG: Regulatory protein PchR [Candidatus Ordinivivax streblomastigis]
MNIQITNHDINEIIGELQVSYFRQKEELVYGHKAVIVDNSYVNVQIFNDATENVAILENKIQAKEDMALSWTTESPRVCFSLALSGNCYHGYGIKKTEEQLWTERTTNLWFCNEPRPCNTRYQKGKSFHMVEIMISPDYIATINSNYPQLMEAYYRRFLAGETFNIAAQNRLASPKLYCISSDLLTCNAMGNAAAIYRDAKILELLSVVFAQLSDKPENKTICLRPCDKERLVQAKDILLENFLAPPSLRKLALEVGTNEFKLKAGFKELFGNTVFGILFDYRMNKAVSYLHDTQKSIQEIANLVGYEHYTHFSMAFKRKYGITPSAYRQN